MARARDECIACLENGPTFSDGRRRHGQWCKVYQRQRAYNLGPRKRALAAGPVKAWPAPDYSPWATIGEGTAAVVYYAYEHRSSSYRTRAQTVAPLTADQAARAAGAWVRSFYALAAKPGLYPAFAVAVARARERMTRPDWDASLADGWVLPTPRKRRSGSAEPTAPKIVG